MERAQQERLRLVNGAAPQVHLRHRTGARFISLTPDFPVPPPRGDPFSEQTCSRRRSIAATAPASPADTTKAGVFVRPLAGGEVAVLRESSRQRLQRLQKLQQVYAQQGAEAFNEVARKEAERLESKTVVFILASARIRANLRRKRLLEKSGLSLNYTGNLGVIGQKRELADYDNIIKTCHFVSEIFERAPPLACSLKLCQASFAPSDMFWFVFTSPRAERAPTPRAARAGALAR